MKVKLSKDVKVEVLEQCRDQVLRENKISCYQIDCFFNDSISCDKCYLDGLNDGRLVIEYEKVKVE